MQRELACQVRHPVRFRSVRSRLLLGGPRWVAPNIVWQRAVVQAARFVLCSAAGAGLSIDNRGPMRMIGGVNPPAQQASQSSQRMLVIMPAHNEADSLPLAVQDIRAHAPEADIVVVDDGSTDATVQVAASLGVICLRLACNLGVGGAVQTGYLYAARNGYDLAIQFDADAQHRANQIAALIAPIQAGQADLVVGSRVLQGVRFRFHVSRFVGSRLLAWVLSRILRQKVTDPTSGFRAASARAIRFFAQHYPQSYLADTVEALVWVSRQNMTIAEVPTRMRQRKAGASATTSFKGILHVLRILLAVLVDCLEPPHSEPQPTSGAPRP